MWYFRKSSGEENHKFQSCHNWQFILKMIAFIYSYVCSVYRGMYMEVKGAWVSSLFPLYGS